jgi:hypothetical protein
MHGQTHIKFLLLFRAVFCCFRENIKFKNYLNKTQVFLIIFFIHYCSSGLWHYAVFVVTQTCRRGKELHSFCWVNVMKLRIISPVWKTIDNPEECEWERSVCAALKVTPSYNWEDSNPDTWALRFIIWHLDVTQCLIPDGRIWGRQAVIYRDKRLLTYINPRISVILSSLQWR